MSSILNQVVTFKSADEVTSFTINDRSSLNSGWAASPHYYIKLESAEGIYGADISSESHPVPHAIGERSWDSFRKGKGINLAGSIEGRNLTDLYAAVVYLRQMFWDLSSRKLLWYESGTLVYLTCKVLNDLSVTENNSQDPPKWSWTVGLRCDDPRERKDSDDSLYYTWMV